MDDALMATDAVGLDDSAAGRLDSDRLVEVAGGEAVGVPQAVVGLGVPLAEEVMWDVAIVAGGEGVMAGLLPGVVLVVHDVTVGARLRVAGEVRCALAVP